MSSFFLSFFLFLSVSDWVVNKERGQSHSRRSCWVSAPSITYLAAAPTKCSTRSLCVQTNVLASKVELGICLQCSPPFRKWRILSPSQALKTRVSRLQNCIRQFQERSPFKDDGLNPWQSSVPKVGAHNIKTQQGGMIAAEGRSGRRILYTCASYIIHNTYYTVIHPSITAGAGYESLQWLKWVFAEWV